MAFHKCRNNGCEIQIEVRNTAEGWRPYEESGNMHQCQHSEYAKKQRAAGFHIQDRTEQEQEKNDHGNENQTITSATNEQKIKKANGDYVDHTLAATAKLKLKILTDPTPEGLSLLYNSFGESHNIRFSQYHPQGSLYTIAVFFEEIPLKQ